MDYVSPRVEFYYFAVESGFLGSDNLDNEDPDDMGQLENGDVVGGEW